MSVSYLVSSVCFHLGWRRSAYRHCPACGRTLVRGGGGGWARGKGAQRRSLSFALVSYFVRRPNFTLTWLGFVTKLPFESFPRTYM
jgi:hypothetical protein